jgi:hypothetical protein
MFVNKIRQSLVVLSVLSAAATGYAYVPSGAVGQISTITKFYDDDPTVILQLDSGDKCYFNVTAASGQATLSVVEAFYLSGRRVRLYCDDAATTIRGFTGLHRLFRIDGVI